MNYRYLSNKSFDSGITIKSAINNGMPIFSAMLEKFGNLQSSDVDVVFIDSLPDNVNLSSTNHIAKNYIQANPILNAAVISVDGKEILPLSQQFDFKLGESFNVYEHNKTLLDLGEKGTTLWDMLNSEDCNAELRNIASQMFNKVNPLTASKDIRGDEFFAPFVPLVSLTGVIPPQLDDEGGAYFNQLGNVTVAELLDSLNAINCGSNSTSNRKTSLDNRSSEEDFFNEGYNSCIDGVSSPFYRLYTREELMKPITRLELAYIVVVCWNIFRHKYGYVNGGVYPLGINADWSNPSRYVDKFKDGRNYKVYKKILSSEELVGECVDLNIQEYMADLSITEFKKQIKDGVLAIPLPMFMCLFELDALDLFYFEDNELSPIKEVSRGEWCYFITKLAKEFPTKFISSGDNTYS